LDRGVEQVRKRYADQPVLAAMVLGYLGRAYANLGMVKEAAQVLQNSVDSRVQANVEDDDLIETLNTLVGVYYSAGDFRNVEPVCRKLVEVAGHKYGEDAATTLMAVNNLAVTLQRQGNLPEAEEMFRRAYEGRRRSVGADHVQTIQ